MAALIVFCENPACGAIFTAPNIIGGKGSAKITFENSRAGACPRCGGPGRIPDGVYEYSNNVIRFLTGPSISLERLRSVEVILRGARRDNEDKERLLRKVAETSPAAATAFKGIPEHTWVQWLAIVIALVSLAIQIQSTYFKKDEKTLEKKFLEHLLQETEALAPPKTPYKRPSPKIPRNDPCPCESGKKYKQCCGLQQT